MKVKANKSARQNLTESKSIRQDIGSLQALTLDRKSVVFIGLILLLTFLSYLPSFHNDLNKTWDDQSYVTNNTLIRDLSFESIKLIFVDDAYHYPNYHPLSTISLAINYHFSGLNSSGYHYTNLFIHLLNTLLVFVFIFSLTPNRIETAVVVSLLFGLLPIHVESVAWISERKDVLYTFFFLLALITYRYYLFKSVMKFYFITLLFFFCSLLSKGMATSLPFALLLIDYYEKRKWSVRIITEKIPFFILSVGFGLLAMYIQSEYGALTKGPDLPVFHRLLHACYGLVMYIPAIIWPTGLSAYYPYPYLVKEGASLMNNVPLVLYGTFLLTLLICCFIIFIHFKRLKYSRVIIFGFLFYVATIALVLQFFPVGSAIMADRYAYVPSIGILFIVGYFFATIYSNTKYRYVISAVLLIYCSFLFKTTYERCKIWKNDETIWTDVLKKYPNDDRVAMALKNRAIYYMDIGKLSEATNDLLAYLNSNPYDVDAIDKVGKIYALGAKDIDKAFEYFQYGYQINPMNVEINYDLAKIYGVKGDYTNSLKYFLKVLELKRGGDSQLYQYIGNCYQNLGQTEKAKEFFDRVGPQ